MVNTNRSQSVKTKLSVRGAKSAQGRVYWYALEPEFEIFERRLEHTFPRESTLDAESAWTFPAASVSAIELQLQPA